VKWQGYIPPERMRVLLQATVNDPTPGPSIRAAAAATGGAGELTAGRQTRLVKRFDGMYDTTRAGWGSGDKYLDADALEFEMLQSTAGDAVAAGRARATLDSARKLIDPVWGGIDQYSTDGTGIIRILKRSCSFRRTDSHLCAGVHALARRRRSAIGQSDCRVPGTVSLLTRRRIFHEPGRRCDSRAAFGGLLCTGRRRSAKDRHPADRHAYLCARERLGGAGAGGALRGHGDGKYLTEARRAVNWIEARRGMAGGGFRHDRIDAGGPYLGDTLAMVQAYLALYARPAGGPI